MQSGNRVEWFTAAFPGGALEELIDGVSVVRRGRQWTVHAHAIWHYRGRMKNRFDVVIDEINTIPFFTPLWAGVPRFVLIWQLARQVWWYESRFPLNAIGYILEPLYLRVYRRTPAFTFSASTAADLRGLGFRGEINVVPPGIEPIIVDNHRKATEPTFIYVGRLAASKRVHEIIRAFAIFRAENGAGQLELIGDGSQEYVHRLDSEAKNLGIDSNVHRTGWLKGDAKYQRMAEAHALLMASAREGWGLVVTECNACGTPAVVYDVPGLRDSVRDMETGIVVNPSPQDLATGMLQLIRDPGLYARLQRGATTWAATFTYEAGESLIRQKLEQAVAS